MGKHRWLVVFGSVLSLGLLALLFSRLDWAEFWRNLQGLDHRWLLLSGLMVGFGIALRSLRWNLVAGSPLSDYPRFWQAANLGYLGNLVYPARAGEVLRIAALHHFLPLGLGRVVSSALLDRVLDVAALGVFSFLLLAWQGNPGLGATLQFQLALLLLLGLVALVLLLRHGQRWHAGLSAWQPPPRARLRYRLRLWLLHLLESLSAFQDLRRFGLITLVTLLAYGTDCYAISLCMQGFGWTLPFTAAITVSIFIALGAAMPSAPGYVGVYQVACVLALKFYGVDETSAVAFSLVFQLLGWLVIGGQGGWVALRHGFRFSRAETESR